MRRERSADPWPSTGTHSGVLPTPWLSAPARIGVAQYLAARRGNWGAGAEELADAVRRQFDVASYDVIHGHGSYMFSAAVVAQQLALGAERPYLVTAHGSDINFLPQRSVALMQQVFGQAQAVFFVSDDLRRAARAKGIGNTFSDVTPNGVDPSVFTPAAGTRQPERLLFVGSFAPVKGVDRLPAIMGEIWRRRPDAELHLVGDGPAEADLRQGLIGGPVTFHGSLTPTEVASLMASSSVLLLPSRSEGWPTVVLEAQATGARVVATDACGATEAVGPGGAITSSDPFNPARFAAAVVDQLNMNDRQEVVERARAYSWPELGRKEAHLISLAAQRSPAAGRRA